MNTSNFINLIGNLGADPKSVTLNNGQMATEFSLATNDYYRDREGVRQVRTEWHTIKAYGKLAELFDQYLHRGKQVSIVGSMRYRKWVDKHDQNRIAAEVIADSFSFLGSGQDNNNRNDEYEPATNNLVAEPGGSNVSAKTESRRSMSTAAAGLGNVAAVADADTSLPF
jgi:single-strand DNA-binding protein